MGEFEEVKARQKEVAAAQKEKKQDNLKLQRCILSFNKIIRALFLASDSCCLLRFVVVPNLLLI